MQKKHIITIGGLPGSGKSTIKRILAEKLDYKAFSIGDFVRRLAIESGKTLEKFNEQTVDSSALDERIDAELKRIEATEDNIVVDSHLAYHFIPSGFSVFLHITPAVSAERIYNDHDSELRRLSGETMETLEEAITRTQSRIETHATRYKKHYGLEPYSPKDHDLVIDAISHTPEAIADMIIEAYQKWITTDQK